jgi:hypothetical protein
MRSNCGAAASDTEIADTWLALAQSITNEIYEPLGTYTEFGKTRVAASFASHRRAAGPRVGR